MLFGKPDSCQTFPAGTERSALVRSRVTFAFFQKRSSSSGISLSGSAASSSIVNGFSYRCFIDRRCNTKRNPSQSTHLAMFCRMGSTGRRPGIPDGGRLVTSGSR